MRYNRTPAMIKARFNSVCPETGREIKKGEQCAYFPVERKAYHEESEHAGQVRGLEFNEAYGMADANW